MVAILLVLERHQKRAKSDPRGRDVRLGVSSHMPTMSAYGHLARPLPPCAGLGLTLQLPPLRQGLPSHSLSFSSQSTPV